MSIFICNIAKRGKLSETMETNTEDLTPALDRASKVVRQALKIQRRMCTTSADRLACDLLLARLMDARRDIKQEQERASA